MSITLTVQEKKEFLFIESKGTIENVEQLIAQSQMIYDEVSKHDFRKILVYQPETQLPLDLVPYFNLVKNYMDEFPLEIRQLKIAVVISEEYKESSATWETICQSRGLQYFIFTSLQDAINCLINEKRG